MAHAEVVAHLVGHGGSHANGILRVVLLRETVQVKDISPLQPCLSFSQASQSSTDCTIAVRTGSVTKARALNYPAASVNKYRWMEGWTNKWTAASLLSTSQVRHE